MWTSDFKRAVSVPHACGAALLLNVKGKPVGPGVFLSLAADEFLISVPAGTGRAVFEALDHLLVADDVELRLEESTVAPWSVVVAPEGFPDQAAPKEVPPVAPEAKDRVFVAECRDEAWRIPLAQLSPRHEERWFFAGEVLPSDAREMSEGEWLEKRIAAGRPEWKVDYDAESLVLEFPFHDEISFHKGCYIGQEVVARGTYRGRMNRGFARFEGEDTLQPGLVYSESDPEKAVGKLTSCAGRKALGLVRLAALESGEDGKAPGRLFQRGASGSVLMRSVEVLP